MKIGLIDVDGHNFPNIPLMKLSAYHKRQGDQVSWYRPLLSGHMDIVYLSKVFSFTDDYLYPIDADQICRGGSGYCIKMSEGKEKWEGTQITLPDDIEHIYPDYSLYGIMDRAFGFLSRGCPRCCQFCVVKSKEGTRSYKVADLSEFWRGQPNIEICDPNILACPDRKDLLLQLAESKAKVNINQGLDARLLTAEVIEIIRKIKMRYFHFAWDNPADEEKIIPKLKMFKEMTGIKHHEIVCYVLVNYESSIEQDFHRIYTLRSLNIQPYVMIYDKKNSDPIYKKIQRWVNAYNLFWSTKTFEEYTGR